MMPKKLLVEAGMFADPYSNYYGAKGLIPVVFDQSLYKQLWGLVETFSVLEKKFIECYISSG